MHESATVRALLRPALALGMALAAGLAAPAARAQANESVVVERPELIDPEISQPRAMITWVDKAGGLWLAGIDRDTGMLVPKGGKGVLLDADAMKTSDFDIVSNGPEWVSTQAGDQVVYTKFLAGKPHQLRNARLAWAWQSASGAWSNGYIDAKRPRNTPYASHDAQDPLPRISYVDAAGNHYWRNLFDPSSETRITAYPPSLYFSLRFVDGARAATFAAPVDGVSQVFLYWLDQDRAEQITFDDGQKDLHSRPWIWQAPEFGGAYVLATVVDDTELRLYVLPPGGSPGAWTVTGSIRTPEGGVINSPEPFVHNGKSYVLFTASKPPATYPSTIFLAGIDEAAPTPLQLTPDVPLRIRTDPEVFVANDGPYIYYNRAVIVGDGDQYCLPCNEGLYRTYTGLPPAQ